MRLYIHQHRSEFVDASQSSESAEAAIAAEAQDALNAAQTVSNAQVEHPAGLRISEFLPHQVRDVVEPLLRLLIDMTSGIIGMGLGQFVLVGILALLALGNAWSLIRSASLTPRGPPMSQSQKGDGGQEVAHAVRSVLEDYFTNSQRAERDPSLSPADWRGEARALRVELEVLEDRVARLKAALADVD